MRPDADEGNAKNIWQATGYAANLLTKVLQPYVLGTAANSPAFESDVTTAVRRGSDATMLMVVNGSDAQRTLSIDFTKYKAGTYITRYRLGAASLQTDLLPDSNGEIITLPRGGSVVYLFPFVSSTKFLQPALFRPTLPSGAHSAHLSYTYIYIERILQATSGVDCTMGCMVQADPRLGDLYYQFTYTGADGRVVGRSDVTKLVRNRPTSLRQSQ